MQRQAAYQLLADVYADGITPDSAAIVRTIPGLNVLLPEPLQLDQEKAAHQNIFGFNVFPYAGVYLTEDGKLGGDIETELTRFYLEYGFDVHATKQPADHLANHLCFLGHLIGTEVSLIEQEASAQLIDHIKRVQQTFLRDHLLPWLFPFINAIKSQGHPFYNEIADLTGSLASDHLLRFKDLSPLKKSYPQAPAILDKPETGLKQIAVFIMRPIHSGLFLSKHDVKRITGDLNTPAGFGDRVQLLHNAFQSAVNFDALPGLIALLQTHVQEAQSSYASLKEHQHPYLDSLSDFWLDRLAGTQQILDRMSKATY